ncbi:MAG: JAB domain-containing protein [Patescibacteria group bacterium]|jgi:DNA repair protein RadC
MIIHLKDSTKIVFSPKSVWEIVKELLASEDEIDRDKEHFWVFHLDVRNRIKLIELVSLGTLNSSLVHPREVFARAVGERSAQIIIAHNHPSGEHTPSEDDLIITKRLVKAGEILGIELIDHLVVTATGFTSFKKKGLI